MRQPTKHNEETFLEKPTGFVIKRQPRNRQPLPAEPVKLPRPKPLQQPQQQPTWLMALPTLGMAVVTGVISYASGRGGILMVLPMLLMGGMTLGIQLYMGRSQKQKIDSDNHRVTQLFRENIRTVREDLDKSGHIQFRILQREKPPVTDLVVWVQKRAAMMWERQPSDDDFLAVRIGQGAQPLSRTIQQWLDPDDDDPRIEQEMSKVRDLMVVDNLPITANLNVLSSVGLRGQRPSDAIQLTYTILVNITVLHSPDEVHLYLISHRPDAAETWGWVRWLPHTHALHRADFAPKLSFSPSTDEEVLTGLAQELRRREDTMRQNRRMGVSGPHLMIILDNTPNLRGHQIIQMILAQKPSEQEGRLAASILFVENPIPPQVNGMIEVRQNQVSFRETWGGSARQQQIEGSVELTNLRTAEQIGRQMAPLKTLESFNASGGGLPSSVRLVEMLAGDGKRVDDLDFRRFYETSYDRRHVMSFPIGINRDSKPQYVTLRETGQKGNGQHAILAGGTGKGKSITLQSVVVSLAATHSPKYLNFILADFKGGSSELAKLKTLPHVVGFVTDLKPSYVERFRLALEGEITRRKLIFEATPQTLGQQITNIYDYNDLCSKQGKPFLPHLILVIDEFHKARELNEQFQKTMDNGVAAQGRALGMHLLLSTQKAEDFGSVLPNIEVKMSMGMNRAEDSKAIFKRDEAFTMLKRPGQAYIQALQHELEMFEMFQVARTDTDYIAEEEVLVNTKDNFVIAKVHKDGRRETLYEHEKRDKEAEARQASTKQARPSEAEVIVERIVAYCREQQYPSMPPVCLEPLPEAHQLPIGTLLNNHPLFQPWRNGQWADIDHAGQRLQLPLGMIDLPQQQKQVVHSLDLNQGDGNLLVVGPQGAGKAVLVRSLLLGLAMSHTPADVQFYILSRGPALQVFEEFPHCGGVIRTSSEKERFGRALHFFAKEIERRKQLMGTDRVDNMAQLRQKRPQTPFPALFLVVEDVTRLREEYEDQVGEFNRLAAEGKSADVHLVIANNSLQGINVRLLENLNTRIALGLKSTADYVEVLTKRAEVVDDTPGRGYVFVGDAREFQAASPRLLAGSSAVDEEVTENIRRIGQEMKRLWENSGRAHPTPIEALPFQLDLLQLWEQYPPPALTYANLQSNSFGLDYDNLNPVVMDPTLMDPVTLVIGPKSSGKTEWILSFCLSLASKVSPQDVEIVVISFERYSPLRYLVALPHITYVSAKSHLTKLEHIRTQAIERQQKHGEQQENTQNFTTRSLAGMRPPAYTVIVVDGWQMALKSAPNLNEILQSFWTNDLCRVILADNTPSFEGIFRQDYNIGNAIKRYGSHVLMANDEPTFNLLGANVRVTTPMKKLHGSQIGKGRAYFSYNNDLSVVQFATIQSLESGASVKERVESIVATIRSQYVAEEEPVESEQTEPVGGA